MNKTRIFINFWIWWTQCARHRFLTWLWIHSRFFIEKFLLSVWIWWSKVFGFGGFNHGHSFQRFGRKDRSKNQGWYHNMSCKKDVNCSFTNKTQNEQFFPVGKQWSRSFISQANQSLRKWKLASVHAWDKLFETNKREKTEWTVYGGVCFLLHCDRFCFGEKWARFLMLREIYFWRLYHPNSTVF